MDHHQNEKTAVASRGRPRRNMRPPSHLQEFHHGREYPVTDSTDQEELDHDQNGRNMDDALTRIAKAVNGIKDAEQRDGDTFNEEGGNKNNSNELNNNSTDENGKGNDSNHDNGYRISNETIELQPILQEQPQPLSGTLTVPVTDSGKLTVPVSDSGTITVPATDSGTITVPATDSGTITVPVTDSGTITVPVTAQQYQTQQSGAKHTVFSHQGGSQTYVPFNNVYEPGHENGNSFYNNYSAPYPSYTGWFENMPPAKRHCARQDRPASTPLTDLQPVIDMLQDMRKENIKRFNNLQSAVTEKIEALGTRLDNIEEIVRAARSSEFPSKPGCLPMQSRQDVIAFETLPDTEYNKVVHYLGSLTSGTVHEKAHVVLKEAISDTFAATITVQGKVPNTMRLDDTRLFGALYAAVSMDLPLEARPKRRLFVEELTAALRSAKQRYRRILEKAGEQLARQ